MTTIHMNVNAARGIKRELLKLRDSIQRIVQSTNSTVLGMPQHWRGGSANQCMELYQDSISRITGVLEPLGEIAAEIEEAIQYWESVAERLSD
jgi:uncharacterized protein YukE